VGIVNSREAQATRGGPRPPLSHTTPGWGPPPGGCGMALKYEENLQNLSAQGKGIGCPKTKFGTSAGKPPLY